MPKDNRLPGDGYQPEDVRQHASNRTFYGYGRTRRLGGNAVAPANKTSTRIWGFFGLRSSRTQEANNESRSVQANQNGESSPPTTGGPREPSQAPYKPIQHVEPPVTQATVSGISHEVQLEAQLGKTLQMADKEILQPQSTPGIQPAANDYNVGEESVGLAPQDEAREDAVGTVTSEHEQPDSWSGPLGGPPAIQATASETLKIARPEPAELGLAHKGQVIRTRSPVDSPQATNDLKTITELMRPDDAEDGSSPVVPVQRDSSRLVQYAGRPTTQDAAHATRTSVTQQATVLRIAQLEAELESAHNKSRQLEDKVIQAQEEQRRTARQAADTSNKLATARQREEELNAALNKAETQLQDMRADRAAKRVFGETEAVDGKAVVTLFEDFVVAVNDLVFLVADSLDEEAQNAYIALDRIRDIATTNEHASLVLESFLKPIVLAQAKVELIAMPMMQYIMFSILALRVFHPTSLAGPDAQDANQYLQYIQNCVAAHEPQEKYGRWRVITYSAIRAPDRDAALVGDIVNEIHVNMYNVLAALLPSSSSRDGALQSAFRGFEEHAAKVVRDAIKLQDTMQLVYVSHDYAFFLPSTAQQYSASEMEVFDLGPDTTKAIAKAVQGHPQGHGTVILPVMPGLRAMRVASDRSRSIVVIKMAFVVTLL